MTAPTGEVSPCLLRPITCLGTVPEHPRARHWWLVAGTVDVGIAPPAVACSPRVRVPSAFAARPCLPALQPPSRDGETPRPSDWAVSAGQTQQPTEVLIQTRCFPVLGRPDGHGSTAFTYPGITARNKESECGLPAQQSESKFRLFIPS